ncbi:MAG: uracil-DNA glycosylase [Variovorax sp.]|nr:MAG: uracil-DNA glycosylase [Variovorax sp.]
MSAGTLNLDARQRAMLDEMGVKVWWPAAEIPAAIAVPAAVEAAAPAAEEAPAPPQRVAAPVRPAATVAAPAPVARAPIASSQGATILIDEPRLLHGGEAESQGGWLIVADMPPELDGRPGEPFDGDAGRLFENMLRALQLHAGGTPVHLMRTHRGVASGQPGSPRPLPDSFADAVAALAPRVVLAMGPLAAQSLLQSGEPLGRLRGRAARLALVPAQNLPLVITYHPAYLLRNPADKARAWADLCLAAEQFQRAG